MSRRAPARQPFVLGDVEVQPGRRAAIDLSIGALVTGTPVDVRVHVLHGRQPGPRVWVTASVHGDEIQGVEIIRRLMGDLDPRRIHGTVLLIPVVNVHGYVSGDRYLPDRRDLNRAFPGSARGSLAARIAQTLMSQVVRGSDVGIDLHTAALGRENLAQVRADLSDPRTAELAEAFGAPVSIDANVRDGSLRQAATEAGCTVLLYEGGEALRYDEPSINTGHAGSMRVLRTIGVVPPVDGADGEDGADTGAAPAHGTVVSSRSYWVRASRSGIVRLEAQLGDRVDRGASIATVFSPHGRRIGGMRARAGGIVIGVSRHPLVNRGDAVTHIAVVDEDAAGNEETD